MHFQNSAMIDLVLGSKTKKILQKSRHGFLLIAGLVLVTSGYGQTTTTFTATINATTNWTAATWVKTGDATNATYPGQTGYLGENIADVHHVVVLTNNGTGRIMNYDVASSEHIGNVTINNAPGVVTLALATNELTAGGNFSGGGTLSFTSGTLNIAGNNTHTGTFTRGTGTVNYNGTSAQQVRGTTYYNLTLTNSSTKTLQANTNVANMLTVNEGATLALSTRTLGAGTAPISTMLYCGASAGSTITGTGVMTLGGGITVNNAGTGSNGATVSCPMALGATRTFTVADDGTTSIDLSVSGVVSGNNFGITKAGAGTIALTGANTFTGAVTINAGILSANTLANSGAGNVSSLGTGAGTAAITIAGSGTLQYTGTGHSTNRAITLTGNGATIDASGTGTMTLSGGVTGNTFNLILTGSGNGLESGLIATTSGTVTKTGTGSWTLSASNTYTGLTTISEGTLMLGAAGGGTNTPLGTIGTGSIISSGAVLDLNGFTLGTAEALTLNGNGISEGGALINSSATAVNYNGAITLGSASSIGTTGNITLGGNLTGTQDLTKIGTGSLSLGTGTVTINSFIIEQGSLTSTTGTLNIAGDFVNSGTFNHNNGTVNFNRAGDQNIGGETFNNLTLSGTGTKTGTGNIVINNAFNSAAGVIFSTAYDLTFNGSTDCNASINATDGTVTYNTTSSVVSGSYFNLTLRGNTIKTLCGAINVNNNLYLGGSTTLSSGAGASYSITGSTGTGVFTMEAGTTYNIGMAGVATNTEFPSNYTADRILLNAASTVAYIANTTQTVSNVPVYGNLVLSTNNKTVSGDYTINGSLTINTAVPLNLGTTTSTWTIANDVTVTNTGSLTFGGTIAKAFIVGRDLLGTGAIDMSTGGLAHLFYIGRNNTSSGTFTAGSGTVNYNGTGTQTIRNTSYYNLTVSGSSTKTLAGATTVQNNLYITGTATLATGANNITGSAGSGSFVMDDGTTLTIGDPTSATAGIIFPSNYTTGRITLSTTSNVIYQQNAAQTVSVVPSYGNLTLTTGAAGVIKTATGDMSINGNLFVNNGTGTVSFDLGATASTKNVTGNISGNGNILMNGAAHILNIGGDNNTTGTFTPGTSTINYNGSNKTQVVRGAAYYNLTISGGGVKYLNAAASIAAAGTLTLTNGILQLGNYNFSVLNTANTAITGSYGNTTYIGTNNTTVGSTGMLIKSGSANANFQMVYPVGSGGYYSPMTLNSLTETGAGTLSIKAISAPQGPEVLKKYWDLRTAGITVTAANVSFAYVSPDEVDGTEPTYTPRYNNGAWGAPANPTAPGSNPFGSTNTGANLAGLWTAGNANPTIPAAITYYSYQSGDWSKATTWTTDASGTLWTNGAVPRTIDNIVILNGRTIKVTANNTVSNSLEINDGGILNLGMTTGNNFGTVTGKGILKLQSSNFPGGTYTNFVSAGGGTVEYNSPSSDILISQYTYNNLIINLDNTARVLYTLNDLTINGNLTITQGVFRISDNNVATSRSDLKIDIKGNVVVDANGSFTVGTRPTNTNFLPGSFTNTNGNTAPFSTGNDYPEEGTEAGAWVPRYYDIYHKIRIAGSFTNNGFVRFVSTNVAYPDFYRLTVEAAATVVFTGATDNDLICNGFTDFYNMILDKGTDQTYTLTVNAARNDFFRLWGRNDMGGGGQTDAGNPELRKALWVKIGTLKLTGSTTIASLAEGGACAYQDGTPAGPNSDIYIPEKGALVIDGPDVILLTTADSYQEVNYAWGFNAASNVYNVDLDGCSSFSIRGKVTLNDGYFSSRESGGIIFWPGANGTLVVNGGTLDAPQLRSADGTDALATFIMTGGNIQLRGQYANNVTGVNSLASLKTVPINFTARSGASLQGARGTFNIAQASNVFEMSGGTISIYDICAGADGYAIEINAAYGNIVVTEGTFNIYGYNSTRYNITSNGPLYNLNTFKPAGTGTVGVNNALTILNDLNLNNSSTFATTGSINANNNLTVGHDFIINGGTIFTPGTNTTSFNGTGSQLFNIQGSISGNLNHFTLAGTSSLTLNNANPVDPIIVNGNFTIGNGCTLIDNGRIIELRGTTGTIITNSGTHFMPVTGAGSIQLTGTAAQTITGDGTGTFNNLTINKTGGSIILAAGMNITGELRLAGTAGAPSRLDVGLNRLRLAATAEVYDALTGVTQTDFSSDRMIVTKGLMSDNGVSREYNSTNALLYPFGFYNSGNSTYYYMPATIQFTQAPTTSYGTVTTRPVNSRHYLAQSTNSLGCYWKTTSTGFSGIPAGSVRHQYNYNVYFVGGTESAYYSGVYNGGSSWTYINAPNKVDYGNHFFINDVANSADGDYTAGETATFDPIPVLYSSNSPDPKYWDDASSWSTSINGAGGVDVPTSTTLVYIGDGTYNHTIIVRANTATAGSLNIASGSTLDLSTYIGHNFAAFPDKGVSGGGTLRIATNNYFPAGDFGDFIDVNGGTVEYYTSSTTPTNITVPLSSASGLSLVTYKNLKLSPLSGNYIILPNQDLTIYGNLTISGTGTTVSTDGVRTPAVARTFIINGDLNIETGLLQFFNNVAHTIRVLGNTTISPGADFRVNTAAGTNHNLELYGDLTNNGTFIMDNTGRALVTFKGTTNATIGGSSSGVSYRFYNLVVNKGIDATTVLNLTSNISTGFTNPFLTLTSGTFRVNNSSLTVTLSTTAAFSIPAAACLSVNQGTTYVGGANNNGDVTLSGKIEVLGGTLSIGNNTNNNNDIEYAAAGTPQIDIQGGVMNVYGQIRRNTATTSGALKYSQSSGVVTIFGQNPQNTRGRLEIVNTNSSFTMSGGSIIFAGAGSTNYEDIYLRPDVSSVSGGTIQAGTATSTAGQTFTISSVAPLWDIVVGQGATNQNLRLMVLPMTIQHDLTINTASQFMANDKNVFIGHDLVNNNTNAGTATNVGGYQAGANATSTQTTTFNGSNHAITGSGTNVTNFANLVFAHSGTATLSANTTIRVNTNLTLQTGIVNDGGNTVTVIGNVDNSATHTSSTSAGGINFAGTLKQYLSGSGTGKFGNVILNNLQGVDMIDNMTITGQLNFASNGILYIDDYLLTFDTSATILGTPDASKMVMLNGVLSDQGVRKIFNTGDTPLFTFPIGSAGKYTPVSYNFLLNSATNAYITVRPVNDYHPSIGSVNTNRLKYYWYVVASGFGTYDVDQQFTYDQADVYGTESAYLGQRYDNYPVNLWAHLGSVVSTTNNTITLLGITTFIDGEFTAGDDLNYTNLPTLYSRGAAGDWETSSSWSYTSGGSGGSCGCTPNGNPVVIEAGQTITLATDGATAHSVAIMGTLDCDLTTFHNLGHVTGSGRIRLTATNDGMFVFPGGEYDGFLLDPNSTIEFTGTTNATLPLKPGNIYKPYNNVEFTGTGIKYMSAENMKVIKNLTISSSTTLRNTLYNKNIYILGNWTDQNLASGFYPGTGLVRFEGTSGQQTLSVSNTENFYDFAISNSSGLSILGGSSGINISNYLYLSSGNINTDNSHYLTITNTLSSAVVGGSSSSFVNGPMRKKIINGQSFVFPIGSTTGSTRYGYITLQNASATTSPSIWTAAYYNSNPSPTYPTVYPTNLYSSLSSVSNNEYWIIGRPTAGSTAKIKLRWDGNSYPGVTGSVLQSKLRVSEYESASTKWYERSTASGVSGTASSGTITSSSNISNNDYVFTIGLSGVTATISNATPVSICNNNAIASIPVVLTGTAPWTLKYRTSGPTTTNFTQTGIISPNYTIQLTGTNMGGAGSYTLSLTDVADASATGICSSTTKSITVSQTYLPAITGTSFTVGTGEDRIFSTTDHTASGASYSWVWTPATPSGGTITTPALYTTHINPVTSTAGSYNLKVTETVGSCSASDTKAITVIDVPSPSITPTTINVCQGSTIRYSTPIVGTHTYNWTITGGTPLTGTGDFIDVTWGAAGPGTVTVDEYNGVSHGYNTRNYTISAAVNTYNASAALLAVCSGGSTNINLDNSQSTVTYQLRDASTHTNIGLSTPGVNGPLSMPTGTLTASTTFEVYANNIGCNATMSGTPLVTVNPLPAPPTATDQTHCSGKTIADLISTPPSGCVTDWYSGSSGGTAINSGIVLDPGTYYAESRNTTTSCTSTSRTTVTVTINPLPVVTISIFPTPNSCDSDPVTLTINLSGGATYDFDLNQTQGVTTTLVEHVTTVLSTYTKVVNPIWVDLGTGNVSVDYTYSVNNLTATGCYGADQSVSITTYKRPETGPNYHIPNNFGL